MLKQLIILLTGGIGSGKSTVCTLFELLGIPVYYSDERAKWLLDHSDQIKLKISQKFGSDCINASGTVNKARLGRIVFSNTKHLDYLNALIHPLVQNDFKKWKSDQKSSMLIIESALLNKSNSSYAIDKQIVVLADEQIRIKRVMLRDKLSEQQVRNRMKHQLDDNKRIEEADYIIKNDGKSSLIKQSLAIYEKLLSEIPS